LNLFTTCPAHYNLYLFNVHIITRSGYTICTACHCTIFSNIN
jgi:hypothetical protein